MKEQDARRGKAEVDIKKRNKEVFKSPISPFWLGKFCCYRVFDFLALFSTFFCTSSFPWLEPIYYLQNKVTNTKLMAFFCYRRCARFRRIRWSSLRSPLARFLLIVIVVPIFVIQYTNKERNMRKKSWAVF